MTYKEYTPCQELKSYVKCFYSFATDTVAVFEDKAFATGCVEMMFNLGGGTWQTKTAGKNYKDNPGIELWGQVIEPLAFRSMGRNVMFGIRFYPHAAALFLNNRIQEFNNCVTDLGDVMGSQVKSLHSKLMESNNIATQISLAESFLLAKLTSSIKIWQKVKLVEGVLQELKRGDFLDNIQTVATKYGITSRYLQKLFLQYTGLTPKLYHKINRFQNSLVLLSRKETSLTDIAYECGYFDQSHFIREFRSFTGVNPSAFGFDQSSALLASANK